MNGRTLGIVADHQGVGFGHVGRTLAIAQAWRRGGGAVHYFLRSPLADAWRRRIDATGASIHPFGATGDEPVDAWVVDGYRFEADWYRELRAIAPLLVVDDFGTSGRIDADLVLDPNLGASADDYPHVADDGGNLLLGPRYALLRGEVISAIPEAEPDRSATPRTLLVSIGGEPSSDLRSLVDATLERLEGWALETERLENVDDVGAVLRRVDVALSAAGSTSWELCAFGIPCVLVPVASNQEPIARHLAEAGAAIDAGDLNGLTPEALADEVAGLLSDPTRRSAQAAVGRALVDGRGADRVVDAIGARLRPAPPGPARSRP